MTILRVRLETRERCTISVSSLKRFATLSGAGAIDRPHLANRNAHGRFRNIFSSRRRSFLGAAVRERKRERERESGMYRERGAHSWPRGYEFRYAHLHGSSASSSLFLIPYANVFSILDRIHALLPRVNLSFRSDFSLNNANRIREMISRNFENKRELVSSSASCLVDLVEELMIIQTLNDELKLSLC